MKVAVFVPFERSNGVMNEVSALTALADIADNITHKKNSIRRFIGKDLIGDH